MCVERATGFIQGEGISVIQMLLLASGKHGVRTKEG